MFRADRHCSLTIKAEVQNEAEQDAYRQAAVAPALEDGYLDATADSWKRGIARDSAWGPHWPPLGC